jgi:hypothetical protein
VHHVLCGGRERFDSDESDEGNKESGEESEGVLHLKEPLSDPNYQEENQ